MKFLTTLALTLSFSCLTAFSGTNGFFVPFFRGSATTEAGYWENFTAPVGAPGNSPDRPAATTSAILTQSDTNAIITGSGNLYNITGVSSFTITDATPFPLGTVVVQVRTLGAELNPQSVFLIYTNTSGPQSLPPTRSIELNRGSQPGLGATVSSLWQWDLSQLQVDAYSVVFAAADVSLSFDSMTLDTSSSYVPLFALPTIITNISPSIERWMYPHNAAPCDRTAGSVFGTLADDSGVDSRHAQHLLGWETASIFPTNRGSALYLIKRCHVTLTINRGNLFAYDPTQDPFVTYLPTNNPAFLPDNDPGRPIELFGAAFRSNYTAATFDQCAPFGSNSTGERNAYAAGWSTNGTLVDVSNNVGKTNEAFLPFEVTPFAVGHTTNAAPGELVPAGAKVSFDLNLSDPFVLSYLQNALNDGRLRLMLTSLHGSGGQTGAPSYPDFVTRFNQAVVSPTSLELEAIVLSAGDVDQDTLPDDWELFYSNSLTHNAAADSDSDGASNGAEFRAGTNPANNASSSIVSLTQATNGPVTLEAPYVGGRQYTAEFTGDFRTWNAITNPPVFHLATGIMTWVDDAAGSSNRFYRVRSELINP